MYNFNTLNTPNISSTLGICATPSSSCLNNIDITNASVTTYSVININEPNLYNKDYSKLDN
jgi:hypothetical protein